MYLRDVLSANLRHEVTGYYYANSMEQSQFRESDSRWTLLFLWSLQIHYNIHWTPHLRRLNLVNTVTSYLFKILFNIILPSRRYSEWFHSCRFSGENRVCIIYNKPTRCNSGSIVFIKNYKCALHVSDALCLHLQEHYKL